MLDIHIQREIGGRLRQRLTADGAQTQLPSTLDSLLNDLRRAEDAQPPRIRDLPN
ncbi:hypothetical protein ACFQ4O_14820 [Methylopila musalis]|uniref:Anti-sigma factor NepR domain-containing protein n=1 Tax=Methylopila musalis TaxID=1134781 RepID=A0ABW3ZAM9_9HYPH